MVISFYQKVYHSKTLFPRSGLEWLFHYHQYQLFIYECNAFDSSVNTSLLDTSDTQRIVNYQIMDFAGIVDYNMIWGQKMKSKKWKNETSLQIQFKCFSLPFLLPPFTLLIQCTIEINKKLNKFSIFIQWISIDFTFDDFMQKISPTTTYKFSLFRLCNETG